MACTDTSWGALTRHYLTMVLAMGVGMVVLQPVWAVAFDVIRLSDALHHATVMALVMATNMSVGMGLWMRKLGHSWRSIVEMGATMYLPFVLFLPLMWAGLMSGGVLLIVGHVLMLPTMFALMLWRRDEYGHVAAVRHKNQAPAELSVTASRSR